MTATSGAAPRKLSVVVTVVDGGLALERCLRALREQDAAPELEVLVPFDASVDPGALRGEFPSVRFLDLGAIATESSAASESGRHELYDRRRAAGIAAASGDVVALLEDRGAPRRLWARNLARLFAEHTEPAIGGAIECAGRRWLSRAVYLCDFGRYALPRPEGPSASLSDTNVAYARAALEAVRETWAERFHEPRVHAALAARGGLWFSPDVVVDQLREDVTFLGLLAERFHWGRLFGAERSRPWPAARRPVAALLAPLLPPLLWVKLVDQRLAREGFVPGNLAALVVVWPLLVAWSLGEALGYASGSA